LLSARHIHNLARSLATHSLDNSPLWKGWCNLTTVRTVLMARPW
jgi:hypothetical protein